MRRALRGAGRRRDRVGRLPRLRRRAARRRPLGPGADLELVKSARRAPQQEATQRRAAQADEGRFKAQAPGAREARAKRAREPPPTERRERLVEVYREVAGCTRCPLHETRTKVVFGAGNADADLMFVGEAPGAEEDRQGLPFVGRAGTLLNELLGEAGISREDVFITNVLKSRPPGNRDPQPDEIEACRPYLERQVELIEPRVIATLGNFATKLLTGSQTGITRVRGTPQVARARRPRRSSCCRCSTRRRRCARPSLIETLREDFATLPGLLAEPPPEPEGARRRRDASRAEPRTTPRDQLGLFG